MRHTARIELVMWANGPKQLAAQERLALELIVVVSQYEAAARISHALGVEVDEDHQWHLADWTPA